MTAEIVAAGVVLVGHGPAGPTVLVVHRPHRADWSLPKGKLEVGESPVSAAVRECFEETGVAPVLQTRLPTLSYRVAGRPKTVHYWRARARSDTGFTPTDEVDELRWLPAAQAVALLTYPADRGTVATALALPETSALVILRHAHAVKRARFEGADDAERPLSAQGLAQARALAADVSAFGDLAVHSSTARRCRQTAEPVAAVLGTAVVDEPALTEDAHRRDEAATRARAAALARQSGPLVVCTHRPVLPTFVDAAARALGADPTDAQWHNAWSPRLPPGGFIVVHRSTGVTPHPVAVEVHPAADSPSERAT